MLFRLSFFPAALRLVLSRLATYIIAPLVSLPYPFFFTMSSKLEAEAASPRCVQQINLPSMDQGTNCTAKKNTSHKTSRPQRRTAVEPIEGSQPRASTTHTIPHAPTSPCRPNCSTTSTSSSPISALEANATEASMSASIHGTRAATKNDCQMETALTMTTAPDASEGHQLDSTDGKTDRTSEKDCWIRALLTTKFYGLCPEHPNLRKNDLNLFCTQHNVKICQYCHATSKVATSGCDGESTSPLVDTICQCRSTCTVLHVSRYMYHDVLLAREASVLLDLAHVQSYLNNGNRVVYIDRRAQPRSKLAPNAKSCAVCDRTLQDPYKFCSIFCRLAFDKHPAAVASLPLPDGTPLLCSNVRKGNFTCNLDTTLAKGERECTREHGREHDCEYERGRERERERECGPEREFERERKGSAGDKSKCDEKCESTHEETKGNRDWSIGCDVENKEMKNYCDADMEKSNGIRKRSSESVQSDESVGRQTDMCEERVTKRCRKRRPVPSLLQRDNGLILTL